MEISAAHNHISEHSDIDLKRIFHKPDEIEIGTGVIIDNAVFPEFDEDESRYRKAQGNAYIFSHECDFHQDNERVFNDRLLLCPLIDFEAWIDSCTGVINDDHLYSLLANIAKRNVFRLIYLPCYDIFKYGALMYMNAMTNSDIKQLEDASYLCLIRTTTYGQWKIDDIVKNHLFRPYINGS